MKYLITSIAFLSLMASKPINCPAGYCEKLTNIKNNDTIVTLDGKWVLMPVLASDTAAGKIPFINFDLKKGKFSGNTGCNNMNGSFLLLQDALRFNEKLISTRKACPGYNEGAFLENLLKTNRFEIKDGVLQLMFNTTILSKWVRHIDKNPTKQI